MSRASLGLVVPLLASIVVVGAGRAQSPAVPVRSALEPATTGGLEVVDRALAKLSTHARLLIIGAHPDDEDTSLLTLVARGLGGEAGYLALSRGEGGQNLIGPELGEGLGLIRTQELLAARRVDGARQYFTRAFDFGYTRSLDETLGRWPRQVLLEDVARVIWRFRPQVVVTMFSPEIGGHGQHLAAGWVAQEIFGVGDGAGLPSAVRDRLLDEGWLPWVPEVLYRRTFFDPEHATFEFPLGQVDSLSGKSIVQVAMASRSQHRSQDMGMLQPLGERRAGLERVAGGSEEAADLFDGIDTTLAAIAGLLPEGPVRREVERDLGEIGEAAHAARSALSPARLSASIETFAAILRRLRAVHQRMSAEDGAGARMATELVAEKIEIAEAGLVAAASIGLEAVIDRETVAPGGDARVAASVWDAGGTEAEVLGVELETSPGWSVEGAEAGEVDENGVREWSIGVRALDSAEPSMAYFSRAPRDGDLYDWSDVPAELRGLPYQDPELSVRFVLSIAGQRVERLREVVHVSRDQAIGEVRRPVRVVPRLELSVEPRLLLWEVRDGRPRPVRVTLRSHLERAVSGHLQAESRDGWVVAPEEFSIPSRGGEVSLDLEVRPPPASAGGVPAGRWTLEFHAELDAVREKGGTSGGSTSVGGGEKGGTSGASGGTSGGGSEKGGTSGGGRETMSVPVLEYPHIRPTPRPLPARLEISAFEIELPETGPIGYVRGASDRVPELLREIGLEIVMLDDQTLARGDLGRFRVIVIGSRAYETDPVLAQVNERLLEYVRGGGRLLVQYQQYQFARGGYAPYPLDIARPHDRITDETAPVRLLDPSHPVFNRPNVLSDDDWEGWVQERGLYFSHSWGYELVPLLSMTDPGMEPQRGGLLVARLGEGVYIYTGLAFFRQLPAGVAGGYRLLANLLAVE